MDNKTIFTKTAKGVGEAVGKTRALSRDLRSVLKEVDGKASLQELFENISGLSEAKIRDALNKLSSGDYIREFIAPTLESDTLDFTTITPLPKKTERPPGQRTLINEALRMQLEARAKAEVELYERMEREQNERERRGIEEQARRESEEKARRAAQQRAMKVAQENAEREAEAKRQADEQARRDAEEAARLQAEMQAQKEIEEEKRQEAERQARQAAEEKSRREAEAVAKQEAEERERRALAAEQQRREIEEQERVISEQRARAEAEERTRREAEEQASKEAEIEARRLAEEQARAEAEQQARREAAEQARQAAEAQSRKEQEERRRREAEELARQAEQERLRVEAEQHAQKEAEESARLELEELARQAEEEKLRLEAEERERQAEEEKLRLEAEERARQAEAEKLRLEAEAAAKQEAEERERRALVEEQERLLAEQRARAEAEELATRQAEAEARRRAEEQARDDAQALADKEAEEEIRREFEELARQQAEDAARQKAAQARRQIEELAQRKAEAKAKKEEEKRARKALEAAEASREAEVKAKQEVEQWMREAAQEKARKNGPEGPAIAPDELSDAEIEIEDPAEQEQPEPPRRQADAYEEYEEHEEPDEREQMDREDQERIVSRKNPKPYRKPIKWGKPVALGLFFSILLGLGLIHVIAFDRQTALFEKTAAAQFRQPVKIGNVYLSLLPLPHWRLEDVSIGAEEQITVPRAKAMMELGSLFGDRVTIKSLDLESPVLSEQGLAWLLFGQAQPQAFTVERISASNVRLASKEVGLPAFNATAGIRADGTWDKITADSVDAKTRIQLRPDREAVQIELNANSFDVPFGSALTLGNFNAKGIARRDELVITDFTGHIYEGIVSGTAKLQWGPRWTLKGDVHAKLIDVSQLVPGLLQSGRLEGNASYTLQAEQAGNLFAAPHVEGLFAVRNGTLLGVDFAKLLRSANSAGQSSFGEITGTFVRDGDATRLQKVYLDAGLLSVKGNADIGANQILSGQMTVELKSSTQQARRSLAVAGTLQNPQFNR